MNGDDSRPSEVDMTEEDDAGTFAPVGPSHLIAYDAAGPDRDEEDDSIQIIQCPQCGTPVVELPAIEEPLGTFECPACGEEFDAG